LLKGFGSVARLARASEDEIASTPGVGPDLARAIHDRLTTSEPAGGRRSA
jgi:ERCC4-type nuclease